MVVALTADDVMRYALPLLPPKHASMQVTLPLPKSHAVKTITRPRHKVLSKKKRERRPEEVMKASNTKNAERPAAVLTKLLRLILTIGAL
ncbi:hypothetical protein H2198_010601 [Neophaeococcomyces mojaviensis]|uniref:Uncharacterized protein n=1 Tax=Neophaeococcomyces mojaviensis TaxID=3383035 RepID=A0ACC2ZRC3_9EURO|nr:hypothetical protein H2198_010601 [Knufia sp. JES_112]